MSDISQRRMAFQSISCKGRAGIGGGLFDQFAKTSKFKLYSFSRKIGHCSRSAPSADALAYLGIISWRT
jgi:hypothetical protein